MNAVHDPFQRQSDWKSRIKNFVDLELHHYPLASLKDLYKNYFQDAYGPGHIIRDTMSAGHYLDREMSEAIWHDRLLWQPLGINHEYIRVNLILIKKQIIPRNILLQGMMESSVLARKPDLESWKLEWAETLEFIKSYKPLIPDLSADEQFITELLSSGKTVLHHSKQYITAYQPHYRIIHCRVFSKWIKQYDLTL